MFTISHHWTLLPVDFDACQMYKFLIGVQRRILMHYGIWSQFLQRVLVSKCCIRLNSNLLCILCITALYIVSILVDLGLIVFLQEQKQNSYTLQSKESNYQNYASVQRVFSTKFKFDMCIADQYSSFYINFGMSRMYTFFTGYTKCHTLCLMGSKYLFHFSIVKLFEYVHN